ncbi:MAG: 16S rRNA (cytosine(1402)-N(4))-methyltransferase RsmH [Spirochaetales bacterium]|nr:16S rRNA (cytosine(1402)-N(4))-methyltransferase RsmH [Spirochaetales bacterium]
MYIHTPVLLERILEYVKPVKSGSLFIDATLGEGGYSERFLTEFPGIQIIGIERDPEILEIARKRLGRFGERVMLFHMWFDDFFNAYEQLVQTDPDRIIFDLGISRFHYEVSGRGFSFTEEQPLDMRLSGELTLSACDIVNTYPEEKLSLLFRDFGEERFARRIARAIVYNRKKKPVKTSRALAEIINKAIPKEGRRALKINPATRCFQALRIAVNSELERLENGLEAAFKILVKGGRMGVVSYHSLEDRIVKRFFKEKKSSCTCPPDWPICQCRGVSEAEILTTKPVQPEAEEIHKNRASRSAKLRVIEKIVPREAV